MDYHHHQLRGQSHNGVTTSILPSHVPPKTIGIFGGYFNPIHLGHALVAVMAQQTKNIDEVVLLPTFASSEGALLPWEDRVRMCKLALQDHVGIRVAQEPPKDPNYGNILQSLKAQYPTGTRFVWICGNNFFRWMHEPQGLEILDQVDGLIVQRLAQQNENAAGEKTELGEPLLPNNMTIEYLQGELPYVSSSTFRSGGEHWRSYLTETVVRYLDERPHLRQQLVVYWHNSSGANRAQDAVTMPPPPNKRLKQQHQPEEEGDEMKVQRAGGHYGVSIVLKGLDAVHKLQIERGLSAWFLAMGEKDKLNQARLNSDQIIQEIIDMTATTISTDDGATTEDHSHGDPVRTLAAELGRIPLWLNEDRNVLDKYGERHPADVDAGGDPVSGWLARLVLVNKFNPRITVLVEATVWALTEILQVSQSRQKEQSTPDNTNSLSVFDCIIPELFHKLLEAKEALGRERAFVCSGGPDVPAMIKKSFKMRQRTLEAIEYKTRTMSRLLAMEREQQTTAITSNPAPTTLTNREALDKLLEQLTSMEYAVLRTFVPSTPLALVHRLLASGAEGIVFDVWHFFQASTAAIDFLLSFAKVLAVSSLVNS
eukprot:scaffold162_cov176-Amphora_coffeaeformis.AAC.52